MEMWRSDGAFVIKSGMTVNCSYLQKLWMLCKSKGANLHIERIQNLDELAAYDQIVIAAGAGTPLFSECKDLNVQKLKGQLLLCSYPVGFSPLERSLIGKGYVALGENKGECVLGSTYERGFTTEAPDIKSKEEILPKIAHFFREHTIW
jgi:glycine/D-amino acid oxidase-like deaminating enzyme